MDEKELNTPDEAMKQHLKVAFLMKAAGEGLFSGALILAGLVLSPMMNGYLQTTINYLMLFAPIAAFGLGNLMIYQLGKINRLGNDDIAVRLRCYGVIFVLVVVSIISVIGGLIFHKDMLIGILLALWALMLVDRDYFRALKRPYGSDFGFQLIKGGGVFLGVAYIYFSASNNIGDVYLSLGITLGLVFWVNYLYASFNKLPYFGYIQSHDIKTVLAETTVLNFQFGVAGVLKLVLERIDIFLVSVFIGVLEAGVYAVMVRFASLSSIVLDPIRNSMRPFFVSVYNEQGAHSAVSLYMKRTKQLVVLNFLILTISIFTIWLIWEYLPPEHEIYFSTFLVILLARGIYSSFGLAGSFLNSLGFQNFHTALLLITNVIFVLSVFLWAGNEMFLFSISQLCAFGIYSILSHFSVYKIVR